MKPRIPCTHPARSAAFALLALGVPLLLGCAPGDSRFPLRAPVWQDTDLRSVRIQCHEEPTEKQPHHVSCAPEPSEGTLYWDGAEQMFLRPLSEALGVVTGGESVNVNSLDEVPDSAWFTNRLGVRPVSLDELRLNSCPKDKLLDPDAPDGSWLISEGKTSGSTPGFVIKVPGKGKYLVKVEAHGPERQVAATIIGEAVYYMAGYYASCEQALWVRPSVFKVAPGLTARHGNFGDLYAFDDKAVADLFRQSTMRNGLLRVSASSWIPGYGLQQFRYEGTRSDDPNDVIAHENRRELRAARLLAAWIGNVDCREGNSFDTWLADRPSVAPDSSPGHVVHYQLGTSAALGNVWSQEPLSRRFGYSYIFDWGDIGRDFVTLGTVMPIYERVQKTPGHEIFGYWNVADFDPEQWKNEYPNPAFDRMTERDAAWMARILAHVSPAMVRTLAEMGKLDDPPNTEYLASVLQGRLEKILERYLTRLSPVADVHVEQGDRLCATDLAEWRGIRPPERFRYTARLLHGSWLAVERRPGARLCVTLPHRAGDGAVPDDDPSRYVRVRVDDGVARGPLVAHLYDLGPRRGFFLAGLERPAK
jgi:hypothetical protein